MVQRNGMVPFYHPYRYGGPGLEGRMPLPGRQPPCLLLGMSTCALGEKSVAYSLFPCSSRVADTGSSVFSVVLKFLTRAVTSKVIWTTPSHTHTHAYTHVGTNRLDHLSWITPVPEHWILIAMFKVTLRLTTSPPPAPLPVVCLPHQLENCLQQRAVSR